MKHDLRGEPLEGGRSDSCVMGAVEHVVLDRGGKGSVRGERIRW
jgi:hypothetical protein